MFGLENAIGAGCERSGDRDCAADFARRAAARRAAIDRTLWDQSRGVYLDYRWTLKKRVDRLSAATLYPLFTHVASDGAGGVGRRGGREGPARARRDRRDAGRHRAAMGLAQRLGAACNGSRLRGLKSFGRDRLAETIACRFMISVGARLS